MTHKRLLASGEFDEADIRRMTAAYEAALSLLRLKDRDDSVTELIAQKIIKTYQAGERDLPRLCARALRELGIPLPE
jgi:hypothetical protein